MVRRRGPAGLVAGLGALALALTGCAPPQVAARGALVQFLRDVQQHESAYAYTLLTPAAAASTNFNAFNDAVLASRARYQVVRVRATAAGSALAVVRARLPGGASRVLTVSVKEVGTGGDWMVGAPFTTLGAGAVRLLADPSSCRAGWTGYVPLSEPTLCTPLFPSPSPTP